MHLVLGKDTVHRRTCGNIIYIIDVQSTVIGRPECSKLIQIIIKINHRTEEHASNQPTTDTNECVFMMTMTMTLKSVYS